MRLTKHFIFFYATSLINSIINTRAQMLDPIYHTTLELHVFEITFLGVKLVRVCPIYTVIHHYITLLNMGPSRENLSSGFLTKRVSNQSPQLKRLARKFKFHLKQAYV